jgi:hypothetical protein
MCLKLQAENKHFVEKTRVEHKCQSCEKTLSSFQRLQGHLNICKKKKENERKTEEERVKMLSEKVMQLENDVENLKQKPQIINNNTINNNNFQINVQCNIDLMSFMTAENIKDIFEKYFNIKVLLGAKEAFANFTVEHFLSGEDRPLYICNDGQRNYFSFFDKKGKKIPDKNARILIFQLMTHASELIKNTYDNHLKNVNVSVKQLNKAYNELMELQDNNKKYVKRLCSILPKTVEERHIRDEILKQQQLKDKENKETTAELVLENDLESFDDEFILGYEVRKLFSSKKHFAFTGEIKGPAEILVDPEAKEKFEKFLKSSRFNEVLVDTVMKIDP